MTDKGTLTRVDVAAALQDAVPLTRAKANRLVDSILKHMCQSLSRHQNVTIHRFGSFRVLEKGERVGRNPKTGEEKVISARHVLTFKPSREMRHLVEKGVPR